MRDASLIYAPKKAKTAAADSDKTESPAAGSVSYTHLTLPTT